MENRYTWDEVRALREIVKDELLEEMTEIHGSIDIRVLSQSLIEERLQTYILAGLKP